MAQSPLAEQSTEGTPVENRPLPFLPAALADDADRDVFVAVVRDAESFSRRLAEDDRALQWIEVHDLLGETEVWRDAARVNVKSDVPLDVVVADPATEYAQLYRLVDVREVRPIRVTIPVKAGFLKALRLAASIHLPVRLLPGQPDASELAELEEAAEFYLRDPMVEAPVEYFHSVLASLQTGEVGSLWMALEADPAMYLHLDEQGRPELQRGGPVADPATYVRDHVARMVEETECRDCRWLGFCQGFFKDPDAEYSCKGVIRVFEKLESASEEMRGDLSPASPSGIDEERVSKDS